MKTPIYIAGAYESSHLASTVVDDAGVFTPYGGSEAAYGRTTEKFRNDILGRNLRWKMPSHSTSGLQ